MIVHFHLVPCMPKQESFIGHLPIHDCRGFWEVAEIVCGSVVCWPLPEENIVDFDLLSSE
jgi:hypothetical protein